MNRENICYLTILVVIGSLFMTFTPQNASAQTMYKQESGFFSPILNSFFLRSNIVESTQKIGPMAGYRFNEKFDVALHTEYFSNESKALTEQSFNFSMMNLGLLAGFTNKLSENSPIISRVELRGYKAFLFSANTESTTPSSFSAVALTSFYYPVELAENITFRPNFGTYTGYGEYNLPTTSHTSTDPTQAFNGFQFGPKLGFDTSVSLSPNTSITAVPSVVMKYNQTRNTYNTDFEFNVVLNF